MRRRKANTCNYHIRFYLFTDCQTAIGACHRKQPLLSRWLTSSHFLLRGCWRAELTGQKVDCSGSSESVVCVRGSVVQELRPSVMHARWQGPGLAAPCRPVLGDGCGRAATEGIAQAPQQASLLSSFPHSPLPSPPLPSLFSLLRY